MDLQRTDRESAASGTDNMVSESTRRYVRRVVFSAYMTAACVLLLLDVYLASGYGYRVLGLWRPPSSRSFGTWISVVSLLMLLACTVLSSVGVIRGRGLQRVLSAIPLLFCVSFLVFSLVNEVRRIGL